MKFIRKIIRKFKTWKYNREEKRELDVLDISYFFLASSYTSIINEGWTDIRSNSDYSVNFVKLHILCYLAQSWHLAMIGKPFFRDSFYANGRYPFNGLLYMEFHNCGWDAIPYGKRLGTQVVGTYRYRDYYFADIEPIQKTVREHKMTQEQLNLLNLIWDLYGDKSTGYLENHIRESIPFKRAWRKMKKGSFASGPEISQKDMEEYYGIFVQKAVL